MSKDNKETVKSEKIEISNESIENVNGGYIIDPNEPYGIQETKIAKIDELEKKKKQDSQK